MPLFAATVQSEPSSTGLGNNGLNDPVVENDPIVDIDSVIEIDPIVEIDPVVEVTEVPIFRKRNFKRYPVSNEFPPTISLKKRFRIGGMTTKEIIKKTHQDNAIPKRVIEAFYLEWKCLFLRTRNASKEMFREIVSILIPGIDADHPAVSALQARAMANFNNYRHRFNNSIKMLARKFIEVRNT